MDCYKIEIKRSAEKELRKVSPSDIKRIVRSIQLLSKDPRSQNAQPLKGAGRYWRIRVGDYRIVYEVDKSALVLTVIKIGHRREVYR